MQARAHFDWKLDGLGITENLDRLLRLIHHQLALRAFVQMALQFVLQRRSERAINIIREFVNDFFAVQFALPCWKYRPNFSLSFSRALNSLDFTAGTEMPSEAAVSSVESSSMSRSTNTTR